MPHATNQPIRVAILDAYALDRACLRLLLEGGQGLTVVGEAGTSADGIKMVAAQKPDILLLRLNAAGDPGLDVIHQAIAAYRQVRIILLTGADEMQTSLEAVHEGVLGIVSKLQAPSVLLKAIQKVYEGEIWIEHSMVARVLMTRENSRHPIEDDPEDIAIRQLSEREHEVIELIGEGMKNQQIASELCISESTVRHHLTSIYGKLGVSDRLELLVFVHRKGLVKDPNGTFVPFA
jgi:DNA-binding NarL/FixJ family response regulator